MYDQTAYFCMSYDDYNANNETSDGFFDWLDPENHFPYHGDAEQNYTISSYTVTWLDASGNRYPVTVTELEDVKAEMRELCQQHKMDDLNVWDNKSTDIRALFAAFRKDAVALVKKLSV